MERKYVGNGMVWFLDERRILGAWATILFYFLKRRGGMESEKGSVFKNINLTFFTKQEQIKLYFVFIFKL